MSGAAATAERSSGLGASARAAAIDFYYHSVRLVVANVAWGVAFLAILWLALAGSPALAVGVAPLLAVPWFGLVRLAALIARGDDVVLSDAFRAYRSNLGRTIVVGIASIAAIVLLGSNVVTGLMAGGIAGWTFATLAGWGLVLGWLYALCLWPLLADPRRGGQPLGSLARLAVLIVLAEPRMAAKLGLAAAAITAVSTIAMAAIVTISAAYVALLACRSVLPPADRLEGRLRPRLPSRLGAQPDAGTEGQLLGD